MKLSNRTFIVSGGSSGLGLATVLDLLEAGAYVAIIDRAEPTESLPQSHTKYIQTDITVLHEIQNSVNETISWTRETAAALGGVINCMGS